MTATAEYDAIFFVGRSGAGKGTQAKKLAGELNFFYFEGGAQLRREIALGTAFGRKVSGLVNSGVFLSDEDMLPLFQEKIKALQPGQGIIFDGSPRRVNQAKQLQKLLTESGRIRLATIVLEVGDQEARHRLHDRAKIERRQDDTDEAIQKRFQQYETETLPTVEYLKGNTDFFTIQGERQIAEVAKDIKQVLGIT